MASKLEQDRFQIFVAGGGIHILTLKENIYLPS